MIKIFKLLRRLGITSKYKGYLYLAEAIQIVLDHPKDVCQVTRDIYPVLAERYNTEPESVEHGIRKAAEICWRTHRTTLCEIAEMELEKRPSNSELIDLLSFHLMVMEDEEKRSELLK